MARVATAWWPSVPQYESFVLARSRTRLDAFRGSKFSAAIASTSSPNSATDSAANANPQLTSSVGSFSLSAHNLMPALSCLRKSLVGADASYRPCTCFTTSARPARTPNKGPPREAIATVANDPASSE